MPLSMVPRNLLNRGNVLLRAFYSSTTSLPEMPPCDFQPEEYKSLPYDTAMNIRKDNLTPALLTYYKKPIMIHQGHMQWLWDCDGKRYLDLFGGIVTVSVGHCHPKVSEALVAQSKLLWHTTCIYLQPKIHEYAEKLAATLPGKLKVAYLVNSGSEANDLAMLMARLYTGNFDLISLRNAYHGASTSLMGLTAHGPWLYNSPTGFGVHNVVNPDVYRGPWGGAHCRDSPVQTTRQCNCSPGHCEAGDHYIEQLEDTLRHSCPKGKVAGMFAESIQGVGGAVQYPKGYLKRAFEKIREYGGLCIADEVQTGFGRTGDHFWGFESHDVIPDIVTMAKGIGNGFPLAAVVTTPEIAKTLATALHFNTYGGNPLSCAVGSAVLDVIKEEKCQENSKVTGTYLLEELAKIRDEFDVIGDVRGKGLMIGMELVQDREKKTPLPAEDVRIIWEGMKDMGVLVGKGGLYGSVLRIKPPMCITRADADFTIAVLRKSLENYKSGSH